MQEVRGLRDRIQTLLCIGFARGVEFDGVGNLVRAAILRLCDSLKILLAVVFLRVKSFLPMSDVKFQIPRFVTSFGTFWSRQSRARFIILLRNVLSRPFDPNKRLRHLWKIMCDGGDDIDLCGCVCPSWGHAPSTDTHLNSQQSQESGRREEKRTEQKRDIIFPDNIISDRTDDFLFFFGRMRQRIFIYIFFKCF